MDNASLIHFHLLLLTSYLLNVEIQVNHAFVFWYRRFLNQVCTGRKPAQTWFLKIVSVQMSVCVFVCVCVCVFVCVCVRPKAINN